MIKKKVILDLIWVGFFRMLVQDTGYVYYNPRQPNFDHRVISIFRKFQIGAKFQNMHQSIEIYVCLPPSDLGNYYVVPII
jgi:hypothetical protein